MSLVKLSESLIFRAQFANGPLAFHLAFRILIILGTTLTSRHILCALVRIQGASIYLFVNQKQQAPYTNDIICSCFPVPP